VSVDYETFIVADIPGIIKYDHRGTGLGDKFLRHILRSKVLVMILDGQAVIIDKNTIGYIDIVRSFEILREEIKLYDRSLYKKDFIIAINKIDLISDRQVLQALKKKLERKSGKKAFLISAVTGEGLNELIWTLYKKIGGYESKPGDEDTYGFEKQQEVKIYNIETTRLKNERIDIERMGDEYIVKNKKLERIVAMTDLDNEEALEYLKNRLKKMGIGDRLKKLGIKEGSSVIIGDLVFELKE
jgi:GTP-binding protein